MHLHRANHSGVNFQVAYKIFNCLTTLFGSYCFSKDDKCFQEAPPPQQEPLPPLYNHEYLMRFESNDTVFVWSKLSVEQNIQQAP